MNIDIIRVAHVIEFVATISLWPVGIYTGGK